MRNNGTTDYTLDQEREIFDYYSYWEKIDEKVETLSMI